MPGSERAKVPVTGVLVSKFGRRDVPASPPGRSIESRSVASASELPTMLTPPVSSPASFPFPASAPKRALGAAILVVSPSRSLIATRGSVARKPSPERSSPKRSSDLPVALQTTAPVAIESRRISNPSSERVPRSAFRWSASSPGGTGAIASRSTRPNATRKASAATPARNSVARTARIRRGTSPRSCSSGPAT